MKCRVLIAVVVALFASGCKQEATNVATGDTPGDRRGVLHFPDDVAVENTAINQVIRECMNACLRGDYDRFRSMWSSTEDPPRRQQFEKMWQPIQKISIRAVQPMRHAENRDILYYVHAGFEFGPGARRPSREYVFLVLKEGDSWCVARAPKTLVNKVLQDDDEDS